MRPTWVIAAAVALLGTQAAPALAGGGLRTTGHVAPVQQPQVQQRWHGQTGRESAPQHAPVVRGTTHTQHGGPRFEQRPDPNHQSLYRPMYSLDATNPGESHPYFQTRKDGFGYPASRRGTVYLGNGLYVVPR